MRTFMPPSSYLWFMVTARNGPASIGRGRDRGLTADPRTRARLLDDRPFFFRRIPLARHSYVLYRFPLVLLPTRFFVFPFRPVKAALRLSN